jgi:hypothetical protein
MHEAFLKKYGSFLELAKMGMKAPKRKPSKLELEAAKSLGTNGNTSETARCLLVGWFQTLTIGPERKFWRFSGVTTYLPNSSSKAPMKSKASPSFRESVTGLMGTT